MNACLSRRRKTKNVSRHAFSLKRMKMKGRRGFRVCRNYNKKRRNRTFKKEK